MSPTVSRHSPVGAIVQLRDRDADLPVDSWATFRSNEVESNDQEVEVVAA